MRLKAQMVLKSAPKTEKPEEELKPVHKEEKPEAKTVSMITPSDRFQKAEQFFILKKKYERLKEMDASLKKFKLNDDQMNSRIKVVNGANDDFTINQPPDAIAEVIQICESKLSKALAETEMEVLNFHV